MLRPHFQFLLIIQCHRGRVIRIAVGIMVLMLAMAGGAGAVMPINDSTTISAPGTYVLSRNIGNSANSNFCISITSWKNPKDNDFTKVMMFIDNDFKGNISKGKKYYNATNFTMNTEHTISIWTIDRNGNINKTWTNSSAWTGK